MNLKKTLTLIREAAKTQRQRPTQEKNTALLELANALVENERQILSANKKDLDRLPSKTVPAFRDRLTLNTNRIAAMAESLKQVAALTDPVGEVVENKTLNNGLKLKRVRAPLGVIFMIFESRPNVILEAFSLAFKSGNTIILRGGSESSSTSQVIYKVMNETLSKCGIKEAVFYGLQDYDRSIVNTLLKSKEFIDIVVPRGGEKLIEFVQKTSLMPIIKNDRGLCHAYVDDEADLEMAVQIVTNAKTQRPGVCNALETVLVHVKTAEVFLPMLYKATESTELSWRVDSPSMKILKNNLLTKNIKLASKKNWDTEYLDLIMNCKIVASIDEALKHIERHGSKHSEVIITNSESQARRFQDEVDAAAVYWNASTRFTDGFEFGLGGELGISTQKLHVRGPVGLRELTTPRWIIDGTGQVRN